MSKPLLLFFLAAIASFAADLTGEWNIHLMKAEQEFSAARMTLKCDGSKITGTLNELTIAGTTDGNHVALSAKRPDGNDFGKLQGDIHGDEITGTGNRGDMDFTWTARRAHMSSAAPQTHVFEPTVFQPNFAGTIAPVLRINSGDTIKTTTVDAGGTDAKGVSRSVGGNPETGPFYVEGAMPGDTLAIKFNRIRLNRDTAMSGDRIVPTAVNPWYYRDAKFDEKFDSTWKLDRNEGTATLTKPTERLKNFKVHLQPMLGCVAVAPPTNQSFQAGWLGAWGGNMDYNQVREGVTVYLPVFQEGAMLFVGDGHALEGDGELNGDALETSMDVEFTVKLIRGKRTGSPRFENDQYLMASGIAGSLQDAFKGATTELARWLEQDYKLSPNESNVILGTSVHYDIAEVVDPQYHVVAKIDKTALAGLR